MGAIILWNWCPYKKRETPRTCAHREKLMQGFSKKAVFPSQGERPQKKPNLPTP